MQHHCHTAHRRSIDQARVLLPGHGPVHAAGPKGGRLSGGGVIRQNSPVCATQSKNTRQGQLYAIISSRNGDAVCTSLLFCPKLCLGSFTCGRREVMRAQVNHSNCKITAGRRSFVDFCAPVDESEHRWLLTQCETARIGSRLPAAALWSKPGNCGFHDDGKRMEAVHREGPSRTRPHIVRPGLLQQAPAYRRQFVSKLRCVERTAVAPLTTGCCNDRPSRSGTSRWTAAFQPRRTHATRL